MSRDVRGLGVWWPMEQWRLRKGLVIAVEKRSVPGVTVSRTRPCSAGKFRLVKLYDLMLSW